MDLLTVTQAAQKLRISPRSLRRRIASGEVSAIKLGGRTSPWVIPADEVSRIMSSKSA